MQNSFARPISSPFLAPRTSSPMRRLSAAVLLIIAFAAQTQAQTIDRWKDESLPFEVRARDLTSKLTLEEKANQMKDVAPAIDRLGIPASRRTITAPTSA